MAKVDARKLKDQAAKAAEKRNYAKAAELYQQIAELEPEEADWRQRAGEALRKTDSQSEAAAQFMLAASGYAKAGFLLKAIAVCKVVLQIDPKHTSTQSMLTDLYAQRDYRTPSGQVIVRAAPDLQRTASGSFAAIAPSEPLPSRIPPPPPPPNRPPPPPPRLAPDPVAPLGYELADLDELVPVGAPMEVVPLASVLGGRKSGQFQIVLPEELEGPHIEPEAAAYEISLTDVLEVVTPAPDPMALRTTPAAPPPIPEIALEPPPIPPPPPPPVPLARIDDELSFSGLVEEVTATPFVPPSGLPRIPLLSSLTPDRLRHVIQKVDVREAADGEAIVRQGERGGSLFVIVSGRVRVMVGDRQVATMGESDFFGEQAILTDFPRTATVVATEPTQLLEFSRALLSELVAASPDVLRTLLRFFRDRLLERLLASSALFSSLNPEDARVLAERFLFLELEPKMRVVREGERAPGLFFVLCGEAQVLQGQARIATLGPGDVFGEMSLLGGGGAMASIVTVTKCWALELPRKDFQEIMVSYPQVLAYVSELAERRTSDNSRIDMI